MGGLQTFTLTLQTEEESRVDIMGWRSNVDYRVVGGAVVVLPHLSSTPIMFPLITLCSHYSVLIRFNISFLSLDRVCMGGNKLLFTTITNVLLDSQRDTE